MLANHGFALMWAQLHVRVEIKIIFTIYVDMFGVIKSTGPNIEQHLERKRSSNRQ